MGNAVLRDPLITRRSSRDIGGAGEGERMRDIRIKFSTAFHLEESSGARWVYWEYRSGVNNVVPFDRHAAIPRAVCYNIAYTHGARACVRVGPYICTRHARGAFIKSWAARCHIYTSVENLLWLRFALALSREARYAFSAAAAAAAASSPNGGSISRREQRVALMEIDSFDEK